MGLLEGAPDHQGYAKVGDVQRLGLTILGCGWIARRHAIAARVLRRELVLSFASRDPGNAERYRKTFGGVAAFGSYEAAPGVWKRPTG